MQDGEQKGVQVTTAPTKTVWLYSILIEWQYWKPVIYMRNIIASLDSSHQISSFWGSGQNHNCD